MNFALRSNFEFVLSRIPKTNFTVTGCSLPTHSITNVPWHTPSHDIATPGNKMTYDPLNVEFLIDEQFDNYKELFDWMQKCRAYKGNDFQDIWSDATLTILSNNKQPLKKIRFEGVFPVILAEAQFTTQDAEPTEHICNITFAYTQFQFVE